MNIWVWVSIGVIILFVILFIVIAQLKKEYGDDSFIGNAVETFKNCCKRVFSR